jgi:hypothetical protein
MKRLDFEEWLKLFPDATKSEYSEYLKLEIDSDFTIRSPRDIEPEQIDVNDFINDSSQEDN